MKRHKIRRRFALSPRARKVFLASFLAVVGLFIVANSITWFMYRNRTYPKTMVMNKQLGSVAYDDLSQKVGNLQLIPAKFTFTYDGKFIELPAEELGITKDVARAVDSAKKQKSWLPLVNLLKRPVLLAPVTVDQNKLNLAAQKIAPTLGKEPVSARLKLNGTTVTVQKEVPGYGVDNNSLRPALIAALDRGRAKATPKVVPARPQILANTLTDKQKELEGRLQTPVTLTFSGKTKQAGPDVIASWMVESGETYALARDKILAYIAATGKEFGIRIKDASATAIKIEQGVNGRQSVAVPLVEQKALKTFTYCTAAKGVDASYLPGLRTRLQATYSDARGWSLDGLVEYREVSSGCDFTVWLSAASLMPGFGAICDSLWSCRVGPNVVINFDRWQNASEAWNANRGSLEDYRHMVINHETGHWLSFGHAQCGGPGQPAPVMQQQSIDLQGCTFNPWPTAGELATLRRSLGI
ncbi:MAG TPA: DUF3152 domain-containing protein [Candidatus Saccharimonadales bacterium]